MHLLVFPITKYLRHANFVGQKELIQFIVLNTSINRTGPSFSAWLCHLIVDNSRRKKSHLGTGRQEETDGYSQLHLRIEDLPPGLTS